MFLKTFPDIEAFRKEAAGANVVPVASQALADMETPVSVLSRFQSQSDALFLLESVEGGERWGRYSFLGVSARAQVKVYRDEVVITEGDAERRVLHDGNPFDVLRREMARYRLAELPELPRFCGGLVGYMSYEMVHFFEPRVANTLPEDVAIAEFIIPDVLLVFDNVQNTLTTMVLAFLEEGDDVDQAYAQAAAQLAEWVTALDQPRPEPPVMAEMRDLALKPTMDEERFRRMVSEVKDHIYEGDIIQCVISQQFVCDVPDDLVSLYRAQRYINPSPYMYFMSLGERALIGSSPETMIRLENGVACLRPIAGTRPRGATEQEDRELADELLKDEKERAEHLMLVDLGRNELGRIAQAGTVQVTDLMIIERYSHVMHLVSNVVADMEDGYDAFDVCAASFPAGTLSGAPKVRAMEIIAEQEDVPRGPYGGAVGYIAFNGNMDFAITIRTATVEGGQLTVQAGAGIVADSDPERERMETVNKARSVERALALLHRTAGRTTGGAA